MPFLMKLLPTFLLFSKNDFLQISTVQATLKHEDIILSRNNNSVFLLQNSYKIGKPLISSAPREFK